MYCDSTEHAYEFVVKSTTTTFNHKHTSTDPNIMHVESQTVAHDYLAICIKCGRSTEILPVPKINPRAVNG